MPHGGIPETIEARWAQIFERQSTRTPTTAAALGRSQRIGENCAALKRQRRFFRFCLWKNTIGVTVFSCRLNDPHSFGRARRTPRTFRGTKGLGDPRFWFSLII